MCAVNNVKILLSETARVRCFIFDMRHRMVVCTQFDQIMTGIIIRLTFEVTRFFIGKNIKEQRMSNYYKLFKFDTFNHLKRPENNLIYFTFTCQLSISNKIINDYLFIHYDVLNLLNHYDFF